MGNGRETMIHAFGKRQTEAGKYPQLQPGEYDLMRAKIGERVGRMREVAIHYLWRSTIDPWVIDVCFQELRRREKLEG
jgi:hypothetical protein